MIGLPLYERENNASTLAEPYGRVNARPALFIMLAHEAVLLAWSLKQDAECCVDFP